MQQWSSGGYRGKHCVELVQIEVRVMGCTLFGWSRFPENVFIVSFVRPSCLFAGYFAEIPDMGVRSSEEPASRTMVPAHHRLPVRAQADSRVFRRPGRSVRTNLQRKERSCPHGGPQRCGLSPGSHGDQWRHLHRPLRSRTDEMESSQDK